MDSCNISISIFQNHNWVFWENFTIRSAPILLPIWLIWGREMRLRRLKFSIWIHWATTGMSFSKPLSVTMQLIWSIQTHMHLAVLVIFITSASLRGPWPFRIQAWLITGRRKVSKGSTLFFFLHFFFLGWMMHIYASQKTFNMLNVKQYVVHYFIMCNMYRTSNT